MKIEYIDSCFEAFIRADGIELDEDDIETQEALLDILFDYVKINKLSYNVIKDIINSYGIIDGLSEDHCDQCGHYNSTTILDI
jgi:hypothetical protein